MVLEGKLAPAPVFPDTALAYGTDVFMKARPVPQLHHVFPVSGTRFKLSTERIKLSRVSGLSLAAESAAFDRVNGTRRGGIDGGVNARNVVFDNGPVVG